MAAPIKTWSLNLMVLFLWTPQFCIGNFVQSQCLNVPASEFVGSVRSTVEAVEQVMSIVSKISGIFGDDRRLSTAISDCLDLLDFSMDELSMTLSVSQKSKGTFLSFFFDLLLLKFCMFSFYVLPPLSEEKVVEGRVILW